MLHGLGGDRNQPLGMVDDDLASQAEIVAPDLRGHGATTLPIGRDTLTFPTLATDVAELLNTLPPSDDLTLLGISMGAATCCQLLATRSLPVRRVILVRPAWAWAPHPANLAVFPLIADLLESRGPVNGLQGLLESSEYAAVEAMSPAAALALHGQFTAPEATARAPRLRYMPASAPVRPTPAALFELPVLVIGSDCDPVHPLALAHEVATDLHADFREVAPRYENPLAHSAAVTAAIRQFLDRTG